MNSKIRSLLMGIAGLISYSNVHSQSVTTFAATSSNATAIAVGKFDTVYVANSSDYRIRKIDPTGAVSIFAGSGSPGSIDGTGTAAIIGGVYDMEYSPTTGNLYFMQYSNGAIRKITPGGVVSTIVTVPNGSGLALGNNDTLYSYSSITGAFNKISPAGIITFIASLPVGANFDLKFAAPDTFYLAGAANNQIYRINAAGAYSTLAGSAASGDRDSTGSAASFNYPTGMAVDGDRNLFVTDANNTRIRKITPAGVVTTFAGSTYGTTDGSGTTAQFAAPWAIAIGKTTGALYVADNGTGNIRRITGATALPLSWISYSAVLSPQNNACIAWKIKEHNVSHYQILKSTDGDQFLTTGTLLSKGNGEHTYSFTEPESLNSIAYYRIRQTDREGKSTLSGTMTLKENAAINTEFKVYPSFFTEGITVAVTAAQTATLSNNQGKLLQQFQLTAGSTFIPAANLPAGTYHVQIADGRTQTIFKQ